MGNFVVASPPTTRSADLDEHERRVVEILRLINARHGKRPHVIVIAYTGGGPCQVFDAGQPVARTEIDSRP